MKRNRYTLIIFTAALLILVPIAGLWSWNTLAELFNAPQAQFKHVIAVVVLLLSLRWVLLPNRHGKKDHLVRAHSK